MTKATRIIVGVSLLLVGTRMIVGTHEMFRSYEYLEELWRKGDWESGDSVEERIRDYVDMKRIEIQSHVDFVNAPITANLAILDFVIGFWLIIPALRRKGESPGK